MFGELEFFLKHIRKTWCLHSMLLMCYLIRAVKSIEHNIEHNMKKNIEEFVLAEYFLAKKQRKKCHKTIFLKTSTTGDSFTWIIIQVFRSWKYKSDIKIKQWRALRFYDWIIKLIFRYIFKHLQQKNGNKSILSDPRAWPLVCKVGKYRVVTLGWGGGDSWNRLWSRCVNIYFITARKTHKLLFYPMCGL